MPAESAALSGGKTEGNYNGRNGFVKSEPLFLSQRAEDYGYQDLKPWLSEREECQNLRVRDIDTLARLLKIDEQAEKHLLVFVFEDEDLESAFQTIKGA